MSRNGSGTYSLPAGNPVVTATTITSTWANTTLSDIANALTGEKEARDIDALTSISTIAHQKIPAMIEGLFSKPITQATVIDKENIESEILDFLS